MAKSKKLNKLRLALQWGVFGYLLFLGAKVLINPKSGVDFEAYCPFGGLQSLASYLVNESLACTMTSVQILMGITLFVAVVVFSKLFCSYICPIGTLTEWLGKVGDKLKVRFTLTGNTDKAFRIIKYFLLFVTFYYTLASSELFCKKFDPFFAISSGFNSDVNAYYAFFAILITIFGSIFIRQFWCKYFCPLAALSNIFKFIIMFSVAITVYVVVNRLGVKLSYVWPLSVICVLGYIFELVKLESKAVPFFKITRNESTCSGCGVCDKSCPQGIEISKVNSVKHVDCNLCGDCLYVCPHEDTIQLNKKNFRWIPAVATVVLVIVGMLIGSAFELPTIDEKWGTPAEMDMSETYSRSGIKNIKCFGSAKAFSSKMRRVKGVLGVAAYVKTKTAKVYYNPMILNEDKINKLIFTPVKLPVRSLKKGVSKLKVITLGIENFFDKYDANYLQLMLKKHEGFYGIETEYACPVIVRLYVDENIVLDEKKIKEIVEVDSFTFKSRGKDITVDTEFEVLEYNDKGNTISYSEYQRAMFQGYKKYFNLREDFDDDELMLYRLPVPDKLSSRNLSFLASHLSANKAIVGIETKLVNDDPVFQVYFVKDAIKDGEINKMINSDTLKVTFSNGTVRKLINKIKFAETGNLVELN